VKPWPSLKATRDAMGRGISNTTLHATPHDEHNRITESIAT